MSGSPDIGNTDAALLTAPVESSRKRRWKNLFCPHCDQEVSKTTFYRHKRSYYDSRAKRWTTGGDLNREVHTVSSSDEEGSGQSIDQDPPTSSDVLGAKNMEAQ